MPLTWLAPGSGRPLHADTPHSLSDGRDRWPMADGIPYLRAGKPELSRAALAALDGGDRAGALTLLLQDQDEWARAAPPTPEATRAVVEGVGARAMTLREAMATLAYGPVAHYFAHRWSAPTFLSALGLLEAHWTDPPLVLEVACGLGQVLRELSLHGVPVAGTDVVFSKLWLARHFLLPDAPLACADIAEGAPAAPVEGATLLCHDAFYFLPEQERVADAMRAFVGGTGTVLVGHAHNRLVDQRGVAGRPRTPAEYQRMFPGARLYDDAELARSSSAAPRDVTDLETAEAISLAWRQTHTFEFESARSSQDIPLPPRRRGSTVFEPGSRDTGGKEQWTPAFAGETGMGGTGEAAKPPLSLRIPPPNRPLRLNPLLTEQGGKLHPAWPTPAFAAEYADAPYLEAAPPSADLLARAARFGTQDPEVARLAANRILLDLPEGW